MDKVYLVLRDNHQTGPFTIGELLQQQLKPSDMIWVEGKSTAWTYLSELELIPFPKTSGAEQKLQAPLVDEIEAKAEELRQRVLSSAPRTYFPKHTAEIETYASHYKLPEDAIEFVDHRKEKNLRRNTVLGELVLTCFVIGLFIVGIYKGQSFLGVKKQVPNSAATQLNSNDVHTAQKNKPAQQQQRWPVADTTAITDSLLAALSTRPKQNAKKNTDSASFVKAQEPVNTEPAPREEKKEETTKLEPAVKVPETIPVKKEIIPQPQPNNEANQEEKKGFLKGIFKKKKKDENRKEKADQGNE